MAASPVILPNRPLFINANTNIYTGTELRRPFDNLNKGPGVEDLLSFRVEPRAAGATMSVDVTRASILSVAWVRHGTTVTESPVVSGPDAAGMYRIDHNNATPVNVDIAASDPTNPRIDSVYLVIEDSQAAGVNNQASIRTVTGTPTGGATLDNRTGAGAAPAGSLILADVLVAAAVGSILQPAIRDRRPIGNPGTVPWLGSTGTQIDSVSFQPHPGLIVSPTNASSASLVQGGSDVFQTAVLMWLPRRIVGAVKIRWKYMQSAVANANAYTIFICDASGRNIAQTTGPPVFSGALNTLVERGDAIGSTTFEAGWYYVGFGAAAMTAGSTVWFPGVAVSSANGVSTYSPNTRNLAFRSATGGSGAPATILGFTDVSSLTAPNSQVMVPIPCLSTS